LNFRHLSHVHLVSGRYIISLNHVFKHDFMWVVELLIVVCNILSAIYILLLLLLVIKLLELFMDLFGVYLLDVDLRVLIICLICFNAFKLIFECKLVIQLNWLFVLSTLTWKLLCIYLVQKVTILG